ncbi:hypothetical protein ACFYKQ_19490, partial [Escherichia coli]
MKENKIPVSQEIKKHLLTGISWMIPLIVAAGICIALGQVLGGTDVGEKTGTIPWMLKEGANKRGNSSRLTQSFHFFMFEPI